MERDLIQPSDGEEDVARGRSSETNNKKGWSRFYITIEPIKFALGFTMAFTNGVIIDLLERNICYQKFDLTYAQCLGDVSTEIKSTVQAMTADVSMLNNVIRGIFPLFLVLFVGPWSDTNGRKPFIIIPLIGYAIYYLMWGVFVFFPNIPVMYFLVPSVPLGFTGSIVAMFVCTWSYTCDNFDPQERTMRFTASSSSLVTGNLLGNALSAQVLHLGGDYGFQIVFFTSFAVIIFALIYAIFVLEETIIRRGGRTRFIDFDNVKSTFTVMLIKPQKGVLFSALVLISLLAEIPISAGETGISYLVGKSQFNWDLNVYNLFTAISSLMSATLPMFAVWLVMGVMKMESDTVLVFSSVILVVTEILRALSVNQLMYWLTSFSINLSLLAGATLDTELSDIVSENDQGKGFTMMCIFDALSPLVSIPLYTQVYKIFLPDKTLYTFFISAILGTVVFISSVGLSLRKRSTAYMRTSTAIND